MSKYNTEVPSHISLLFESLESQLNGQSSKPYHQLRKKGSQLLLEQGFPTTRNEDYKYTSFNRVFREKYEVPTREKLSSEGKSTIERMINNCIDGQHICFVNGIYHPELSTLNEEGVALISLSEENENETLGFNAFKKIDETISQTENPFIRLNTALSRDPVLLLIKKGKRVSKPIQIIYYYETTDVSTIASPQLIVIAEEGSEVTILENHFSDNPEDRSGKVFANVFQRMIAGQNAKISHNKVQEMHTEDYLIHNLIASQDRDSHFFAVTADLGSRITRNNLEVQLRGSNTQTDMFGLFTAGGNQHIDNQTFLDHAIPHCESREWYKGVLGGRSRGVFNGKVLVRQDAQKTNAFQQNNTLLISDHARMDSKPQLEIYADDVKCSHGATIGQMDEDTLFYLKSRGLDEQQAGELIKIAFLAEVFESIENEQIRTAIANKVSGKLRKIYQS